MRRGFDIVIGVLMMSAVGCQMFQRDETARGQGFFASKAAKLDVTPQTASKPTNQDVLLVATVYDPDGETLSRRTIEWTIEGPGEFVAIDSGGFLTRTGKKTGGKFATTSTHTFESKLSKKTFSSSSEEPTIKHGQSWVVVSSAVEGRTVVTAVCTDMHDRDKARVVVNLNWADSEFTFPGQTVVPSGGETKLQTDLARLANPVGYRVRYRILGGTAATLTGGGDGVTSLTGGNTQDLTTNANGDGTADVRIVQAVPAMGKTRVGIEVIKPDPNGVGPGQVIAKGETTVEWASANLTLDVKGPATIGEGRETDYTIVVANNGKAESQQVTLRAQLPASVQLVRSEPVASVQQGREQSWVLPAVPPGQKRDVRLTLKAARAGPFDLTAVAVTPDGARAEQRLTANADTAALKINLEIPSTVPVNQEVMAAVRVSNPGWVPVERATVWVTSGEGNTTDRSIGPIEPGKTVTLDVPVTFDRSGNYTIKSTLTADGGLTDRSEVTVEARTLGMNLTLNGPERVGVGESATYTVDLANTGQMMLSDFTIKAELPRGLNAVRADGGTLSDAGGFVSWRVGNLGAGESKKFSFIASGDRVGPSGPLKITASNTQGKLFEKRAERNVQVTGLPVFDLELVEPSGSIAVGQRATYRVVVRNRGTGSARDVQIAIELPSELTGVSGRSSLGGEPSVSEAKIAFATIPLLSSGQAVTVFGEVEAVRSGSARVRAVVTSIDVPAAAREEQATRVTGAKSK